MNFLRRLKLQKCAYWALPCLSVHLYAPTPEPMSGFLLNLILRSFITIHWCITTLVKIGQHERSLYTIIYVCFWARNPSQTDARHPSYTNTCGASGGIPVIRHHLARQTPDTVSTQRLLIPDKPDVTDAIRKCQRSCFEGTNSTPCTAFTTCKFTFTNSKSGCNNRANAPDFLLCAYISSHFNWNNKVPFCGYYHYLFRGHFVCGHH